MDLSVRRLEWALSTELIFIWKMEDELPRSVTTLYVYINEKKKNL